MIQVAKYLGVKPWELGEQPTFWTKAGLICMNAEAQYAAKLAADREKAAKAK